MRNMRVLLALVLVGVLICAGQTKKRQSQFWIDDDVISSAHHTKKVCPLLGEHISLVDSIVGVRRGRWIQCPNSNIWEGRHADLLADDTAMRKPR